MHTLNVVNLCKQIPPVKSAMLLAFAVTFALPAVMTPAAAQQASWPQKPVRIIAPTQAGSAPDIIARIVADKLTSTWKQTVIVDNRPGAGGIIGMRSASSSAPDGYTLVLAHAAAAVVTPYTYVSAKYDIEKDFSTIAFLGYTPMGIVANNDAPGKTLADMIEQSKQNPNKYVLGNPNRTSIPHLAGELLNQQAGAKLFNVSFGASPNGLQGVIKGDATYYIDGVAPLLPMIRSKRVRPVAVFSESVLEGLEGIPLAKDTVPGMSVTGWFILAGPAGMPKAVTEKINKDVNEVLSSPEVIAKFREFGTYINPKSTSESSVFVKAEKARWSGVLKTAGITAE